jgi:hypothetical protein
MKARIMVTTKCNRKCEGCCNGLEAFSNIECLNDINSLLSYEEIMITGGEPMLIAQSVFLFLMELRRHFQYNGKIYIYSALFNERLTQTFSQIMAMADGLHYTLHYEATDQEVIELKLLTRLLPKLGDRSFRLSIDNRLYQRYDFSNIDLSAWSVIRKLQWQDNCQLPPGERLFIYRL